MIQIGAGSALLFVARPISFAQPSGSLMPETYMGWVELDGEMADPIRLLG